VVFHETMGTIKASGQPHFTQPNQFGKIKKYKGMSQTMPVLTPQPNQFGKIKKHK